MKKLILMSRIAFTLFAASKFPGPINPTLNVACSNCAAGAPVSFTGTGYFPAQDGYGLCADIYPLDGSPFYRWCSYVNTDSRGNLWLDDVIPTGTYSPACTVGGNKNNYSTTLACVTLTVQ